MTAPPSRTAVRPRNPADPGERPMRPRPTPAASFALLALAAIAAAPTPIPVATPAGRKEPVSYANEVADVLAAKCVGCHSDVLAENKAMQVVFARTGWRVQSRREGGTVHVTMQIPDAVAARSME